MRSHELSLICRVITRLCALPLEHVAETMRPLAIEPVAGVPRAVRGLSIIRGVPVPVVDVGWMLTAQESQPTRFVAVKAGSRLVALAVSAVVGIRAIPAGSVSELPPLLSDANPEAIAAVGTLDAQLLIVLNSARLVPDAVWSALDAGKS